VKLSVVLRLTFLLILALPTLVGCTTGSISTDVLSGKIIRVHDGDSVHILPASGKRVVVRLAGIDAPEIDQQFGIPSRDHLRAMVMNRQVDAHCHKQDKYQREVCTIFRDGDDVNLQMVRAGLAWHFKRYQDEQTRRERRIYGAAENTARNKKVGLWARDALAPWEFRARK